jgi:hypothetical protein
MLLLEGRAGIGKTSLVEVACSRAAELGHEVLRARGSELESGFAFGVVRQLFERRLAGADPGEREALLAGPAAAARPLLTGEVTAPPAGDGSFAVLHGLYWLVVNLAARGPLLIAIDDAHGADEPSLRWLAYLARRLDGLAAGVLVALRPGHPAVPGAALLAVCAEAAAVLRPALLSEQAVGTVRAAAGGGASDELCAAAYGERRQSTVPDRAAGGRARQREHGRLDQANCWPGLEDWAAGDRGCGPWSRRFGLAQAGGAGRRLRAAHAAAIAGVEVGRQAAEATGPRCWPPVTRGFTRSSAMRDASLGGGGRDRAIAARPAPPMGPRRGRSPRAWSGSAVGDAGYWRGAGGRAGGDEQRRAADGGRSAGRALAEPPPRLQPGVLREAARAKVTQAGTGVRAAG